jgi:hypothetical protein
LIVRVDLLDIDCLRTKLAATNDIA